MKCSHTGHSLPHRLAEWIGCHDNKCKPSNLSKELFQGIGPAALKRSKDLSQGIVMGSPGEG